MDRFSPFAPAYIRVLVLPVGRIERSRFLAFLRRLQDEASIISLADIEPHSGDDDILLSSKNFRQGSLLYNYTTSPPSEQQLQLSPFELFREPLLVLGVADRPRDQDEAGRKELDGAAEYLRERHPRVVHRQLVILEGRQDGSTDAEEKAVHVHNPAEQDDPSLKQAICELSARFLVELNTYTIALQASPSIATPGHTARSLQRTNSQREQSRPSSGHNLQSQSTEAISTVDDNGSRPPPFSRGLPATSFDHIPGANNTSGGVSRSDSRGNRSKPGARASSQDRMSIQGFGSGGSTSQEILKRKGKARVGIVTGSIHMMAGQWSEGLRILTENTNKARVLSDHIWHGKGLECIITCLLLLSWAGQEFQIPSICYPVTERTNSHQQRFSVNLPSDFRSADVAQQVSLRRLSTSLPEMLKLVAGLYRSGEGPLELPFLSISEATIRFCKLLAVQRNSGGELDSLDHLIDKSRSNISNSRSRTSANLPKSLSKAAIADMLSHAQPTSGEGMPEGDHIAILAGSASVYALVGMDRKKAIMLKDLVARLTIALTQARKRGAAEMGIHPAAGLSTENSAEALSALTGDGGVVELMVELARIYGVQLIDYENANGTNGETLSNNAIQIGLLHDLAAFCEALPDLPGVLRLSASWLKFSGPQGAIDTERKTPLSVLSREDQVSLTTTISRTIGVSRNLGIPALEATYWDPFLVRGVVFVEPGPSQVIVDRSKLEFSGATAAIPGNPLLYDPSSKRPGASAEPEKVYILVENEIAECIVTLQNPYEVPVDVESLHLVTDGVELKTTHQQIKLEPLRLQQVPLSVSPCSTGDCKITGCRVKIHDCAEQVFPIINKPWSADAPPLIKGIGQEGRNVDNSFDHAHKLRGPEHATVSATVIRPQPTLTLEDTSFFESSIMLLGGEKRKLTFVLRNTSSVAAEVFDIVATPNISRDNSHQPQRHSPSNTSDKADHHIPPTEPITVEPGKTIPLNLLITGTSTTNAHTTLYYSRTNQSHEHARALKIPLTITTNASLQIHRPDITPCPQEPDHSILSFDLSNAWPKPLTYNCCGTEESGLLAPGAIKRLHIPVPRHESALENLRVRWKSSDDGREGEVQMPETLPKLPAAPSIHLSLEQGPSSVKVGSFVPLRAKVRDKSGGPLVVRLLPKRKEGAVVAVDGVAVVGSGVRCVRQGQGTVEFMVCALLAGSVELVVVAGPLGGEGEVVRRSMRLSVI